MPANMFSPFLKGEVGNTRRVLHSAKNYFQTVHIVGRGDNLFGSSVSVANLSNIGGQAANVAGVVAGTAMIGWGAGAVATGAFAAAVSGPQAAVVLGVIGVAVALKSAYSNREASHKVLIPYVFNMVDDVEPPIFTAATLKEAAAAAHYLICEGQNQYELVASKYQTALAGLTRYMTTLDTQINDFARAKTAFAPSKDAKDRGLDRRQQAAWEGWLAAEAPGGAIFEFVRRCSHTGNYLQAPHIVHLAIIEEMTPGSVLGQPHSRHFHEAAIVRTSRGMFQTLEAKFKENQKEYMIFGKRFV